MENAKIEEQWVIDYDQSSGGGSQGDESEEGSESGDGESNEGNDDRNQEGQGQGQGEPDQESQKQGQGQGNGSSPNVRGRVTKISTPGGQEITTEVVEKQPGSGDKINDEDDSKKVTEEIRSNVNSAKESGLSRGFENSNLAQVVDELIQVEIPWDELLQQAIRSIPVPSDNRSWKNIRKTYRSHGLTIPDYGTEDVVQALYLIEDTSASVSDEDLRRFASVIEQSFTHFKWVVEFQHSVETNAIIRHDRDNFMKTKGEGFKFHGRGGTSHNDVFQKVEEYHYENNEEASLVILLTDYMSDVEEVFDKFEWTQEVPVKVALVGSNPSMVSPKVDEHPICIDKNRD
jgi:hypothetical protein